NSVGGRAFAFFAEARLLPSLRRSILQKAQNAAPLHNIDAMKQFGNRKSLRVKDFDYTQAGFYFITICIYGKKQILGKVIKDDIVLSDCGDIVLKYWNDLPRFFN